MQPNKEFTPQVSVVDSDKKPVKPDKETWYYNDAVSQKTMKWDGKQAVVRYDYTCPGSDKASTVSVTIPPAATSCTATLALPENMLPGGAVHPHRYRAGRRQPAGHALLGDLVLQWRSGSPDHAVGRQAGGCQI